MSTIHQRLRDEHGRAVSPASFRRCVAANVPEETRRSQVRVWDPHPSEAGEQAQIDYRPLGRWLDPPTGKFTQSSRHSPPKLPRLAASVQALLALLRHDVRDLAVDAPEDPVHDLGALLQDRP